MTFRLHLVYPTLNAFYTLTGQTNGKINSEKLMQG